MELLASSVKKIAKVDECIWTIELTDLSTSQGFMSDILTERYLMIGITSPKFEKQVCINSIPDSKPEIVIPIDLENCDSSKVGAINFKGVDQLSKEWELIFYDNRFNVETQIKAYDLVSIQQPEKNTRREYLKLLGQSGTEGTRGSAYELRLKRKQP